MLDSGANKHTWTPLKAKHVKNKIPDEADVVIATGFKTVASTLKLPKSCGIKTHWIRAWEHWQMSEDEMLRKVVNVPTIKLVNSVCLQNRLKKYGTDSHIVRPGYDFDLLYPMDIREDNSHLIIGALNREGVHGNRKRTEWSFNAIKKLKYRNVKLWMFGSEREPKFRGVDLYLRSPNPYQKNWFYNRCDVWIAPTMSEGLHLPPAEAMITECPVVGTDAELSGMQDYLFDGITGLVSKDDFDQFVGRIDYLLRNPEKRLLYGKAARKQILDLGDRKTNMEQMINLFKRLRED